VSFCNAEVAEFSDLLYNYKSQTILICIFVSSILPNFLSNFGNLEVLFWLIAFFDFFY